MDEKPPGPAQAVTNEKPTMNSGMVLSSSRDSMAQCSPSGGSTGSGQANPSGESAGGGSSGSGGTAVNSSPGNPSPNPCPNPPIVTTTPNVTVEDHEGTPFDTPDEFTDVTLVIEERKLFTCKSLLAGASPVFRKMFLSDFKEKSALDIPLPGKKYRAVVELLKCIYPATLKPVDISNVFMILPLADEYDIAVLKNRCEQILLTIGESAKIQTKVKYFVLSDKYKLPNLYQKAFWLLAKSNLDSLSKVEEFRTLEAEKKLDILHKRIQFLELMGQKLWWSVSWMSKWSNNENCPNCKSNAEEFAQFMEVFKKLDMKEHSEVFKSYYLRRDFPAQLPFLKYTNG